MKTPYVPINKGNYSMDSEEREALFEQYKAEGWESEYADYRKKWTELPTKQEVSNYPLLVDIELSSLCNLHCPMCYTITEGFKEKVNATRMEWDLFCKIIDEIGGKVPAIRLSLRGESMLHKKFVECISYAKSKGIKEVSTLTHGAKITPIMFDNMVKAGIDWITVSIDGTGEVYESIRKPTKFDDILEIIKYMSDYKKKRNINKPVIKIQGIWPAIKVNAKLYYDTFSPYADLIAFNPLIDYLGNDKNIEYLEDFLCPQQYQRLVIGADGLVMKCSNDEENVELVGDVKIETVHQIWHGEKMQKVREMHKKPRGFMDSNICKKCYLPRKTIDEKAEVNGRTFTVRNYVFRIQEVGK